MATYVVRLTAEERAQLTEMIATGRRAASMLTRARMLLKAEAHAEGPQWTAPQMGEALETKVATGHRVRLPSSRRAWPRRSNAGGILGGSSASATAPKGPR